MTVFFCCGKNFDDFWLFFLDIHIFLLFNDLFIEFHFEIHGRIRHVIFSVFDDFIYFLSLTC